MNVLEIKNNLLKISYDVTDNLALSGFVIVEDSNSPYVGQVMNLKSDNGANYAIVKLLFTFNDEGILKNYNGTIPSVNATVSKLPANELLDVIPKDDPLFIGNIAQQDTPLIVDKSILDNNLLICSDNLENTTELVRNLSKQIDEKIVIIDPDGQFNYSDKLVPGKDFKLPLNGDAIDYIYENDLDDIDPINKAIIQDILIEVQNYIKTLPENFIPFDTFVDVIDGQYQETKIPELILLKNKLLKYKELDVFAQNLKESLSLSILIEQEDISTIDLSVATPEFQKEIIRYIYTVLNNINDSIYVFAKINNDNITKRLLKKYITKDNVNTIIICPHELKYIEEAKEASQNIIFFAPLTVSHDFASYNTYLKKLNSDEFVIYGAHTQNIPLIIETSEFSEDIINNSSATTEEDSENEVENNIVDKAVESVENEDNIFAQSDNTEPTEASNSENNVYEELLSEETPEIAEEPEISEDYAIEENFDKESLNLNNEIQPVDNILISEEEHTEEDSDSVAEPLDVVDVTDSETIITETPSKQEDDSILDSITLDNQEEIVEQVAKDVDRAFYEKLPEDDSDFYAGNSGESTEDELTEDDLNIIDDLASDDIALVGDETPSNENYIDDIQEETPPVVPIYPADDIEEKDNLTFEPGEKVTTARYGDGIVEKMIKYGNKMLCSIDFPNIGRRLLDPAMTEITRIQ